MSDQRLPLAFAASPGTYTFDPRRTALVLTGSEHPPLPIIGERVGVRGSSAHDRAGGLLGNGASFLGGSRAAPPAHPDPLPEGRGNDQGRNTHGNFAVVRHAGSAAAAQAGACSCCRVPSDLVAVLRRLIIDRARGDIDVSAVLVVGQATDLPFLAQDALADPFVAARYAVGHAR